MAHIDSMMIEPRSLAGKTAEILRSPAGRERGGRGPKKIEEQLPESFWSVFGNNIAALGKAGR